VLALNAVHDHQRLLACSAPSAIGYRTIVGPKREKSGNGFLQQILVALSRLGWKKLERYDRSFRLAFGGVDVSNKLHVAAKPQIGFFLDS